ncbi:unnamed protein product [Penicillium camemberti]|uniref:Str. FM013 n=1 Tax=Penicillium camemberti (strain FM 013) TaxID=1429867 RepID=A0A0G4PKK4_PENC3|nr:unnamed protein product [Penicillium camemberti]
MGLFSGKSRSKAQRQPSEPPYETPEYGQQPVMRRTAQPEHSKFGPHFQKGPLQEQIYERRADGERIPTGHPDLRDRAHSFHQPREHHEYSDPFKKIPKQWSRQMQAEREHYHALCDRKEEDQAIRLADALPVGRKVKPHPNDSTVIKAGITANEAWAAHCNMGAQARGGFAQKYPQSYENLDAIATHEKEVAKSRARAEGYRDKSNFLAEKHTRWALQMDKAQKRSQ